MGKRPSLFYRRMIGMKSSKFHPRYQFAHKGKQSETDATKFRNSFTVTETGDRKTVHSHGEDDGFIEPTAKRPNGVPVRKGNDLQTLWTRRAKLPKHTHGLFIRVSLSHR